MDVTIVGAGDSGLLTALSIEQLNPKVSVRVIDDFDEDPPEVGKATFKAIIGILHDFLDIERERFVREVKPVYKLSVYFSDWCDKTPFHYPFDIFELIPQYRSEGYGERLYYIYDYVYTDPDRRSIGEEIVHQQKTPYYRSGYDLDSYPHYAYQFGTGTFNGFLRTLCEERDITLVNDRIEHAESDGEEITRIVGEDDSYTADLYIDASGFSRVLMETMDTEFHEFDMPLDSAFVTQVDRPVSEIIPASVFRTGDYGWMWEIDTFYHRDHGYVFSSEYVDDDEALAEFKEAYDISQPDSAFTKVTFDSGYHPEAWVGNCVAIGNALGFVEPLQAPNLTTSAQAGVTLSILLAGHNRIIHDGIRETYNNTVQSLWESIYDFIYMHYRWSDGDNAFWERMQNIEGTERTRDIIEEFNKNGLNTAITPVESAVNPVSDDEEIWSLVIFHLASFYSIMRRMGATSDFYEDHDFEISDDVWEQAERNFEQMQGQVDQHLTHRELYEILLEESPEKVRVEAIGD